jgi:hypothetical protein
MAEIEDMKDLKRNVWDYYTGYDDLFDDAYSYVMEHNKGILNKIDVKRTKEISKEDLFGDIDNVISFLKSLKKDGYNEIDEKWSGYEDNYFQAEKYTKETDEEFYSRIAYKVSETADYLKEKKEKKAEKERRIKELEEEIRKLKKE